MQGRWRGDAGQGVQAVHVRGLRGKPVRGNPLHNVERPDVQRLLGVWRGQVRVHRLFTQRGRGLSGLPRWQRLRGEQRKSLHCVPEGPLCCICWERKLLSVWGWHLPGCGRGILLQAVSGRLFLRRQRSNQRGHVPQMPRRNLFRGGGVLLHGVPRRYVVERRRRDELGHLCAVCKGDVLNGGIDTVHGVLGGHICTKRPLVLLRSMHRVLRW